MLVSVITPVYNAERYLQMTYASLCGQCHTNWEWMVVDDCSTDNSRAILDNIAEKDPRVKVISHACNLGAAASRNTGLRHATGFMCAFLDSDDIWMENKLTAQLRFMGERLDFSFTGYEVTNEHGVALNKKIDCKGVEEITYDKLLLKTVTLGCSTVMLRRSTFPDIEMPAIRTGQDYACWLKILRAGHVAHLLPEPLTRYRIRPTSISRNKLKKAARQWQIYREIEGLGFCRAVICFVSYGWHAVTR